MMFEEGRIYKFVNLKTSLAVTVTSITGDGELRRGKVAGTKFEGNDNQLVSIRSYVLQLSCSTTRTMAVIVISGIRNADILPVEGTNYSYRILALQKRPVWSLSWDRERSSCCERLSHPWCLAPFRLGAKAHRRRRRRALCVQVRIPCHTGGNVSGN
jgi:hypothetical protein